MTALHLTIDLVRRGGTISIIGVYGGMLDPMQDSAIKILLRP